MADGAHSLIMTVKTISPLVVATISNSLSAMAECLTTGDKVDDKDSNGWTALHFAAAQGLSGAAAFLLSQGADPLAKTNDGKTPKALAFSNGQIEALVLLEKAEIDGQVIRPQDVPDHIKALRKQVADLTEKFNELAARVPPAPEPAAPPPANKFPLITHG
jgi:ankyrin repeat protein